MDLAELLFVENSFPKQKQTVHVGISLSLNG